MDICSFKGLFRRALGILGAMAGKGNGKARQVKNVALKELGRRLAEAEGVIKQSGPLKKFKCELKDFRGKGLLEMFTNHMDRVETAMFSLTAEAKNKGWTSSKPQPQSGCGGVPGHEGAEHLGHRRRCFRSGRRLRAAGL